MKRKFILAIMLMVISGGITKAQSTDDVFIIGTSVRVDDDVVKGLFRHGPISDPIYETPSNGFVLFSVEKDYDIFFKHHNYKQSERLKIVAYKQSDYMRTVTRSPI